MTQTEEMQKISLETLLIIKDICEKNDIKYTLSAGTLLGAVRHKGFIPWDDDIDVSMTMENYIKFMEIAPKELPKNLFLENYKSEKDCPFLFSKVVNINTTFVDEHLSNLHTAKGIGVDIFPVYSIPKEYKEKNEKFVRFIRLLISTKYNFKTKKTLKSKIFKILTLPISLNFISKIYFRKILKWDSKSKDITLADALYELKFFDYSIFLEYSKIKFEGYDFMCIKDYETYLTILYGNYMKLPPVEQRVTTHTCIEWNPNKSYLDCK